MEKPLLITKEAEEILALLRDMRTSDPIRRAAETVLSRSPLTEELTAMLTESLAQPSYIKWRQQVVAAWALGRAELSEAQREVVARGLHNVVENYHELDTRGRIIRGWVRVSPVTLLLMFALGSAGLPAFIALAVGLAAGVPLEVLFYPLTSTVDRMKVNRTRAAAVTSLGRLARPISAGVVVRAACDTNVLVKARATWAFIRISENLHDGLYPELGRDVGEELCSLLAHPEEPVALAALHALGCGAGGNAVQEVQDCARWGRTEAIRAAASDIMPVLLHRQKLEHDASHLLRPAGTPQEFESLLRPAGDTGSGDNQFLLHPVSYDKE
jgi:hypothetical protein